MIIRRIHLFFWSLLFIAAAAFTATTTVRIVWGRWLFMHGSYYLLAALCLWFLILLLQAARHRAPFLLKREIVFCLAMAIVIFMSTPPYFRILPDESNLISASKSFFETKTASVVIMGQWLHGAFYSLGDTFPTRPLLFPFLVHVIHALTGYRPENAIAFNFLATFGLFLVIFRIFKKWMTSAAGYAAVLLCAAQPVLILSATSAGFDLFATLMTVISCVFLFRYMLRPEEFHFRLLWVQLLLLSHVRYESVMFMAMIIGGLALLRRIPWDYFSRSLIYPLSPLWLAPVVWQQFLNPSSLHHGTGPLLAFSYWQEHALQFFRTFLVFDGSLPFATLINWLGLAGLLGWGVKTVLKHRQYNPNVLAGAWLTASCIGAYWFFITFFKSGNVTAATTWRLFTLFYVVLSCSAAAWLAKIPWVRKPVILVPLALTAFLFYQPLANAKAFSDPLIASRRLRLTLEFLDKQGEPQSLIITAWPGFYTIFNRSAVNFKYADSNRTKILKEFNRHFYSRILVIQESRRKTGEPFQNHELNPAYKVRQLTEIPFTDQTFFRISEVLPESYSR